MKCGTLPEYTSQLEAIERVQRLFERFRPELRSQRYSFLYERGLLSFTSRPSQPEQREKNALDIPLYRSGHFAQNPHRAESMMSDIAIFLTTSDAC